MKQAIILAGGKGTRLQERLKGLPKSLIDICGKPLLQRQIEILKSNGFDQILILVNSGADQIIDFCNQHHDWNIEIECINDGAPRGTAGAVLNIIPKLAEDFLVVYGDTMFDIDLVRFQAFHEQNKIAGATLFLHPNDHPQDSDLVAINEQELITGFYPYPHDPNIFLPNLVNAGLYYFRKIALQAWSGNQEALDFGKDIFPALIEKGILLRGYNSPEYIKDCGTPMRLDKVCAQYESGFISASNLRFMQKLVFLDRDGTINYSVDQLARVEDFQLIPGVAQAIVQLNKSGYRTALLTNQPVVARGECTLKDLENIHRKMQTELGKSGAYIDRIYFCPHHPDSGFEGEVKELKFVCNCRKPAIGMLKQATQDLNADLTNSWLIGDSTADILAAQLAGVRSILLQTGVAGLDEKYAVLPNYIAPHLPAAVQFILHDYSRLLKRSQEITSSVKPGDVILIGGLSRSGKSTLAQCVKDALQLRKISTCILSLDGWLRSPGDRDQSVMGRYDLTEINEIFHNLLAREKAIALNVPLYSKLQLFSQRSEQKTIMPKDVVILEGTIALNLSESSEVTVKSFIHRWFVEISEPARKKRVISEYVVRGMTTLQAEQLYLERQKDEFPLIVSGKKSISCSIDLGLCDDHF